MEKTTLGADTVSMNGVIGACDAGGKWQQALSLIGDLWEANLEMDTAVYNIALRMCANGEQWQQASRLFSAMKAGVAELDAMSYSTKTQVDLGAALGAVRVSSVDTP
ncbi:unnamed protein product [Prorocentrum cordatum]|uniref:Pentacotripeptide-repeat region of PRORP domain-containing protein n=1 Tax=Prorocentrum cordatum TaxID=2364126 RepID=A0ABN9PYU4_9DINO|nr:unnamed protein product [Polarella glacialis]